MKQPPVPKERGHSLLEVSVAMFLVAVVSGLAVRASGPFTSMITTLEERGGAVQELRLALDYLAHDLGGADEVSVEGRALVLRREPTVLDRLGDRSGVGAGSGRRGRGHYEHGRGQGRGHGDDEDDDHDEDDHDDDDDRRGGDRDRDPGLSYALRGDSLIRRDAYTGERFVVASGITDFDIVRPRRGRGREIRITLGAGPESAPRTVTLVWRSQ